MRSLVCLLAVVVLLVASGCAGPEAANAGAAASPTVEAERVRVNETTGSISGLVVDEEQAPLDGAMVGIGEGDLLRTVNTTTAGVFVFNDVEPGSHRIFAQKLGYAAGAIKVDVAAGQVATPRFVLRALLGAPAFPTEIRLEGVESVGAWFQVPYADAANWLPPGFAAKPHVLAESNGQTAEFSIYTMKYRNGTIGSAALPAGAWTFQVLSVTPPSAHDGGATVQFVSLGSHASDPLLQDLLTTWQVPSLPATITFGRTDAGGQGGTATSSLKSDATAMQITVADAGAEEALTSGALSVRLFGLVDKQVVNYVDLRISSVQYSITGGARLDSSSGLAITPAVPAGEGYIQWGAQTSQILNFVPAKGAQ